MDKKILVLISLFPLAILGIAVFVFGSRENKAVVQKTAGSKIAVAVSSKSVGNIPYDAGHLIETFSIKNVGDKNLEVANMTTSCMCTKAYLKQGTVKSDEFGMKGMTAPSSWKGIIKPGETAEVVMDFDPQYHGPQGVGPVTRTLSFETNDPDKPYVEVGFNGTVTK
ncbi:MAG: DUF1573 domain-containing protein [Patescibacteria group bacterium]|nr:DUF1573 domain-containing protein [Patescibacteria group bacterium]